MKTNILFAFPFAAVVALGAGCGDDNTSNTMDMSSGSGDMTMTATDPVKPAMATTQVERMGRATINVAVTNPFDLDYTAVGGGNGREATRKLHSEDGNEAGWVAKWKPILAKTLAIYDGVDMTCGNQFGACGMVLGCGAATAMAGRYDTLATVLADDRLYINTTKTDCSGYLGVEAASLAVADTAELCGGRTPAMDVVDFMYSAATFGATALPTKANPKYGAGDGVDKELEQANDSLTDFPFLGAPNN